MEPAGSILSFGLPRPYSRLSQVIAVVMAKAKASRKGKKEWRRNISTKEYDAVVEKEGHEERTGGSLEGVPDAAIFVVDTVKGGARFRKS